MNVNVNVNNIPNVNVVNCNVNVPGVANNAASLLQAAAISSVNVNNAATAAAYQALGEQQRMELAIHNQRRQSAVNAAGLLQQQVQVQQQQQQNAYERLIAQKMGRERMLSAASVASSSVNSSSKNASLNNSFMSNASSSSSGAATPDSGNNSLSTKNIRSSSATKQTSGDSLEANASVAKTKGKYESKKNAKSINPKNDQPDIGNKVMIKKEKESNEDSTGTTSDAQSTLETNGLSIKKENSTPTSTTSKKPSSSSKKPGKNIRGIGDNQSSSVKVEKDSVLVTTTDETTNNATIETPTSKKKATSTTTTPSSNSTTKKRKNPSSATNNNSSSKSKKTKSSQSKTPQSKASQSSTNAALSLSLNTGLHPNLHQDVPKITDVEYANLDALMAQFCKVPLLAEFSRPVSLLHPELISLYSKVVKDPIDLGKVCRAIRRRQYTNTRQVCVDVWRIFANCVKYHTHPLTREGAIPSFVSIANHLREYFNALWMEYMIPSEIDPQILAIANKKSGSLVLSSSEASAIALKNADEKRTKLRSERYKALVATLLSANCVENTAKSIERFVEIL